MRVPRELLDALTAEQPAEALRAMDETGVLTEFLPELEAGRGFVQPELHYYDVLNHNLAAVAAVDTALEPGRANDELREAMGWVDLDASLTMEIDGIPLAALVRLGTLLHDVAKPETATLADGRLRFPRHGPRGAEMMMERLPALGFEEDATRFVAKLIRYHLRPAELIKSWPVTDRAVRKFVHDGGACPAALLVNLEMAGRRARYTREHYRRHLTFVNYVLARSWAVFEAEEEERRPLVTGDDLITELDVESGRLLGAVLTSVRHAQQEGAISNRDAAIALARNVLATLRAEQS
ncbi:MAG: HD domain-containing protein [Dehalococcoidia bacterium]|nr:HD domain-containing protein [Dehalococcoidia bacterium]